MQDKKAQMISDAWIEDRGTFISKYGIKHFDLYLQIQQEKKSAETEMSLVFIQHDLHRFLEGKN
jgi:hypothetical protein|tara:strand:+ start:2104 stop:2295 length:192 start_codon:yes stop_codon:yes gene_type:complete